MRATCPNNKDHKKFITSAIVIEDWVVDENGNFSELGGESQVMKAPSIYNDWICADCGERALIQDH